ncbi:bifunctional DNA primase/polymerase [Geobacter sp. AOG1]|uniref:bifunctional DNA primase/polymerase n=1 Tax=Geobacter sp. AOG1 TaxID=1566346 RepID=UPI001CC71FC4|nr:bifunctional DNA primase/polymerase [Geobacter sp. AOG1]GFE57410.1 hypothetical protein AOG1_12900 [Geobacter sp. AOG1]
METININLKQAALEYAGSGIAVFPINDNDKTPKIKAWGDNSTTDPTVIKQWWDEWPNANIGIVTGQRSGFLVLDVDVKNGALGNESVGALVGEYGDLPVTRRHNTPSGGYHLLFRYQSNDIRNSASKIGSGLDIRCNGGYIVAPPSVIDGNRYEVDDPGISIADAPEWLVKLASEKKAAEKKSIPVGSRNNKLFQVAIECKRNQFPLEEAEKVVAENNQSCDEPLEDAELQKIVTSAYRYQMNQTPSEIEELNGKYAVVMVGGKCRVLKEINCPVFSWPDIELSAPKDFKEFFSNKYIQMEGKSKRLGDAWFNHPQRRQYEGLIFTPGHTPEGYYNLWRGFAVEPKEGDCGLYLKHIEENIANGNKEVFNYIIAWMAHAVQHPDNLVGTAIVLRGAMGVGKGVFANGFGSLFGRHYLPMNQTSQLTGKFNAHMKDVVVLLADEAFWAGDKAAEGVLKGLITEPYLTIEGKGENAFKMKNHLHMIFATNNDWAVPAGPEERRFFVLDVSDKHKQDHAYFDAIGMQMDNSGREALLHYLINYDLKGINLRKFPQTTALLETKLMSLTPAQKFWYHKLETGRLNVNGWNDGEITTDDLYKDYLEYVTNLGVRHKAADNELGTQLSKMMPKGEFNKKKKTVVTIRRNIYVLPTLDKCREYFEQFVNQKIEWPTEDHN